LLRFELELQAEAVRFELTVPCGTPVFKTGALNHYATPPYVPENRERFILFSN
jgi:hypothetical protein